VVGGAMVVHLPMGRPSHHPHPHPHPRFRFDFGNRVPETIPDTTKAPTHSLVRRVHTIHRGVAGITEDGSCYAHPNTFRAERDARFNWSSYRTVVLHVTEPEHGVIVALFLPPYY